jgi:hypothetical protein
MNNVERLNNLAKYYRDLLFSLSSQVGIRESIAHFDSLMDIPQNHLEPLPLKLSEEPLTCLLDQINFLLSGKGGDEYLALREQLLNP